MSTAACFGGGDDSTLRRGDEAFARGDLDAAIAEYRLALRQRPEEPVVLQRVARASAELRRVDDVVDYYHELVSLDPSYQSQAISELLALARDAADRNDSREMALAVEAALEMEPSIGVGTLAEPLGAFYHRERRWPEALVFLGRAVRQQDVSLKPSLLYDLGQAYQGVGDCARAIPLFEEYEESVLPWNRDTRSDVDYLIGDCSLDVAGSLFVEEEYEEARDAVERTITLGLPPTRLGDAWFLRGNILAGMGLCDQAVASYQQAIDVSPSRTAPLANQARARSEAIRFPVRGTRRGARGPCS